ncbi:hypothetical protein SL003B_2446 [Polymorphum gilvum SL003B-26A1]|uniref:Uncharacterized protein n=1 Tax=Polymorphum gilvum (strain LMG 25793 / CGMCC 1.9160 / SL003B-26A1) TaxID=991905 RepID=F2J1S1_POLGS|nr:hypothetical protein SL003B_2446 [Polymorphum gilvum SL003B-26A1]
MRVKGECVAHARPTQSFGFRRNKGQSKSSAGQQSSCGTTQSAGPHEAKGHRKTPSFTVGAGHFDRLALIFCSPKWLWRNYYSSHADLNLQSVLRSDQASEILLMYLVRASFKATRRRVS